MLAQGDSTPYIATKAYGKGQFIYDGAMQPLIGHGGWAPGMQHLRHFPQSHRMGL